MFQAAFILMYCRDFPSDVLCKKYSIEFGLKTLQFVTVRPHCLCTLSGGIKMNVFLFLDMY